MTSRRKTCLRSKIPATATGSATGADSPQRYRIIRRCNLLKQVSSSSRNALSDEFRHRSPEFSTFLSVLTLRNRLALRERRYRASRLTSPPVFEQPPLIRIQRSFRYPETNPKPHCTDLEF
ncbi:hypothetical protein HanPI659440_Chr11g0422061 [Helianthus annuus]|nr:hypothetical protein HanPI659440_Chr11g0422061 [Helianthus annuus]